MRKFLKRLGYEAAAVAMAALLWWAGMTDDDNHLQPLVGTATTKAPTIEAPATEHVTTVRATPPVRGFD